tara:strand:+ start:730 stop:2343 length:1614 start_codon:yes stop_codon:yes gene_type:complete
MKKVFSVGLQMVRHQGIKPFWTDREYKYQNLILNGFVVQREYPGEAKAIPLARVDIYYDTGKGIGIKKIRGVEPAVWKEASKYLEPGERNELIKKWKAAKYARNFDYSDGLCRKDLSSPDLPPWIKVKENQAKEDKEWKRLNDREFWNDKKEKVKAKFDEKVVEEISEAVLKKFGKSSPLKELFETQDIDPKEVAPKDGLSTLYKHIKGDLQLTKEKAIEYGKAIGVPAASLMFEPKTITIWSNVNLTHKVVLRTNFDHLTHVGAAPLEAHTAGHCYLPTVFESAPVPSELYRVDVKAIKVDAPKSIYHNFVAYYYETNKVSENANNKLCLIREFKNKNHAYYLGIYQIHGTKIKVLNVDPTSDVKVIAEDVNPDLVAPIISFTHQPTLEEPKTLFPSVAQTQKLGKLIRKEEHLRLAKERQRQLVASASIKVADARESTKKLLEKSEDVFKKLTMQQAKMKDELNKVLYRVTLEQEKKAAEAKKFGYLDKFINRDKPIELPDDYEMPQFLKDQSDIFKDLDKFKDTIIKDDEDKVA